jgi:hypothetical protein
VSVALATGPASGTLGGTAIATAVNGVATFSGLTLDTAGTYTIQASSGTLTAAITNSFTVSSAPASQVVITQQPPASVPAGNDFGLQAAIEDPYGKCRIERQQRPHGGTGQDSQTVAVPVRDTGVPGPDLTVNLVLSTPSKRGVLGSPPAATVVNHNVHVPPLVTLTSVQLITNTTHQITQILVGFSGEANSAEAQDLSIDRLVAAGKSGSFTAKNARAIKLRSAVYDASKDTVILTLKKPLALSRPVELVVDGQPPSGLQDSFGRFIDGGSDTVAVLRRGGATIEALAVRPLRSIGCWMMVSSRN